MERAAARKWYASNIEKARKYARSRYAANPEKWREYNLKRNYGLTPGDYAAMVALQDGRCAICGRGDESLGVDHNHATGVVRGLLCSECNKGIGLLREDPDVLQRAVEYLRQ
jgi:hypothetical protein